MDDVKIWQILLVVFVPLLAASLLATGALSYFSARSSLNSAATRLLGFKAEELKKQMDNQWELLEDNDLVDQQAYREAFREAVRSFSATLRRSPSESILILSEEGEIVVSEPEEPLSVSDWERLRRAIQARTAGWVEIEYSGEQRVGYQFLFGPLSWSAFVTESSESFFAGTRQIQFRTVTVFGLTAIVGSLLVLFLAHVLASPLVTVSDAMRLVVDTGNLHARVAVRGTEEIEEVAGSFNAMVGELEASTERQRELYRQASQREFEALRLLAHASEYKDTETARHAVRVGLLSRLLAAAVGASKDWQELIYHAAPLHDAGKLAVPDAILQKPGPLTEDEFQIMRGHARAGYELLTRSTSKYLQTGAVVALTHHEKYDGTGYPNGIAGQKIPLEGRIVGLVDVLDALTSERPYKRRWTLEEAYAHITEQSGKHFDPELVTLLCETRPEVERIMSEYADSAPAEPEGQPAPPSDEVEI